METKRRTCTTISNENCVTIGNLSPIDLKEILQREVGQLSGGELQRFAISIVCIQKADMYVAISLCFSSH